MTENKDIKALNEIVIRRGLVNTLTLFVGVCRDHADECEGLPSAEQWLAIAFKLDALTATL